MDSIYGIYGHAHCSAAELRGNETFPTYGNAVHSMLEASWGGRTSDEVLVATSKMTAIFWDVASCSVVETDRPMILILSEQNT
jgi:hypothetical protein